jgi:hypothetical protein
VDSTDVLRVLGSYPESSMGNQLPPTPTAPTDAFSSSSTKQRTTLFAANPLPYSASSALTKSSTFSGISSTAHPPHPSDDFNLSALLTPSKLIIIGLKPSPRTWFRKLRANEGGEEGGRTGCAAWKVSGGSYDRRDDPVLAWSWGNAVRFLRVAVKDGEVAGGEKGKGTERKLEFVEEGKWECTSGAVVGLDWLDQDVRISSYSCSTGRGQIKRLICSYGRFCSTSSSSPVLPFSSSTSETSTSSTDRTSTLGSSSRTESTPALVGRTHRGFRSSRRA